MLLNALLLASTASATCLHGLSKFKRQEPADGSVPISNFGYTGLQGPFNWASLGPENEACKIGKNQSPINIDASISKASEAPVVTIDSTQPVEFENLGTTIEVLVNGTTSFAGTDFRLKQFHIHTPSEHRVGEEYFPLEAHFVHEGVTDPNALAVIAVLFQLSANTSDPLLTSLQPHLSAIVNPGTKTPIESGLDFSNLIAHVQSTPLFQYTGSLTTPPCAEGLTFLVTEQPLAIDVTTFNEIKKIVKFNARYTQNSLGEENLITVAGVAGTEQQWDVPPVVQPGEEQAPEEVIEGGAQITGGAAEATPGATVVITEIQGVPTSLVGVIQ